MMNVHCLMNPKILRILMTWMTLRMRAQNNSFRTMMSLKDWNNCPMRMNVREQYMFSGFHSIVTVPDN
jgi:hypothetical protein